MPWVFAMLRKLHVWERFLQYCPRAERLLRNLQITDLLPDGAGLGCIVKNKMRSSRFLFVGFALFTHLRNHSRSRTLRS